MQKHPDHHYFTAQVPVPGQNAPVAALPLPEFSSSEKNTDFLDTCVQAASDAVDEARAALTVALAGLNMSLADAAAKSYKEAALLHIQAQKERRQVRASQVGTPEWSAALRGREEVNEDLLESLLDAEQRGMPGFLDKTDFLPLPQNITGITETRGDLRP